MRIPLSAPDITEAEIGAVVEVLESGRLSLGPKLRQLEQAACAYTGANHAVAVSSGTAGLHLAVRALGLGEGDEVLTSPFSFIASANALLYEGARPVFVDIDPGTLNIDAGRMEAAVTARTRAVLVVHVFGRPAPMEAILDLAQRHGLFVVEDACEAIGGQYGGRKLGSLGDVGVYGFYPNKPITMGEGGLVVTGRADWAERMASLRNQGRDQRDPFCFAHLGYNYRLSELHCSLGVEQFRRLDEILARRAEVARAYNRLLASCPFIEQPELDVPEGRVSWFVYVVRLKSPFEATDRDRIARELASRDIGVGRYFPPIHLQPFYRRRYGYQEGDFPVTERVAAQTLALPFFNGITDEQMEEVSRSLADACERRLEAKRRGTD